MVRTLLLCQVVQRFYEGERLTTMFLICSGLCLWLLQLYWASVLISSG